MSDGEREHRRYSPSQADRNFACPGSSALIARVPPRASSPYAVEGTKAHTVLEAALSNGLCDAATAHQFYTDLMVEDLDAQYNTFYFSIDIAIDYVKSTLAEHHNEHVVLRTEQYVEPPTPSAPGEAGGYLDISIHAPQSRTLYVMDYKHGAGVVKDVVENRQLLQYAAGLLYGGDIDPSQIDKVVLVIIQPRAFHVSGFIRDWETTPYRVFEYMQELDDAITECEKPDAPLVPGREQCMFCDARTACPAREAAALSVASDTFTQIERVAKPSLPKVQELELHRLGHIRANADLLRKFLDDVDAHCLELLKAGLHVPGAKLVEGKERREYYGSDEKALARRIAALSGYAKHDEALDELGAVMDKHPILRMLYRLNLIPMSEAEKLVISAYRNRVGRAKKNKASEAARKAFAHLTTKTNSGRLTMVDVNDPRPAVTVHSNFEQIPTIAPPERKA